MFTIYTIYPEFHPHRIDELELIKDYLTWQGWKYTMVYGSNEALKLSKGLNEFAIVDRSDGGVMIGFHHLIDSLNNKGLRRI